MPKTVKSLVIHGKVQGVSYRWNMVRQARRLGVTGWVRNRRDGTVEALCLGEVEAVNSLVEWSRQGPDGARVDRVEIKEEGEGEGEFSSFDQIETV